MDKVLVLFSGGKDSFLTSLLLLEKGFDIYLVTYENGCGLNSKAAISMARRLQKKYGEDRVNILGVKNVCGIMREFLIMYYNLLPSDVVRNYGEVPISQFNCLSCRLAMYVGTIIICNQLNIKCVADGARKSQLFAIEQDIFLESFNELFKRYDIDILYPVKDLDDDFELKNQILIRGFVPKMYEPQCLLGIPIKDNCLDERVVASVLNVYNMLLKDKVDELVDKYKEVDVGGKFI